MSSVVFASPLKAASPLAQSVYDPSVVARPILKKEPMLALPAPPIARLLPKKQFPVPTRADPRFNPARIAKSEASLSTRIFLQTKPHAGEAVVGAQRFLALNRDSELRQFKRQLADTATISVATGAGQSFVSHWDVGGAAAQKSPVDDDFGAQDADEAGENEDDFMRSPKLHSAIPIPNSFPHYGLEHSGRDLLSDTSGDEVEKLADVDVEDLENDTGSPFAASDMPSLLSSHPETASNVVVDSFLPLEATVSSPHVVLQPASSKIEYCSKKDARTHTTHSNIALHSSRNLPPVASVSGSVVEMDCKSPMVAPSKPSRAIPVGAAPPAFAELSKYSQQVVHELANSQQLEFHSGVKIAQKDLLKLRDSFQKVSNSNSGVKQLSTMASTRIASKYQASSAARDSKQKSLLDEPTPPRSRKPVPNAVSKSSQMSNMGLYDIDDGECSTPSRVFAFSAATPKERLVTSSLLPSVSPYFKSPERPCSFAHQHSEYKALSPQPFGLQLPVPSVDSVPCTPRPSTPPQPMQHFAPFENAKSSLIFNNPQRDPAPDNHHFRELEVPQAPPYPDMFTTQHDNDYDNSSKSLDLRTDSPRFERLFEQTDDYEHDVFAAITALSAPLESLVEAHNRFNPRLWLSVIDSDADIIVRIERLKAAFLVMSSLMNKDENEVRSSFKRLYELRLDLLWQTKRRQLRFWLNSSGHIVLGPRKKDVVMRFLGLTPASKHAKNLSIIEPSPGCPGVSMQKRWQGSDFKIQLMLSLVTKYQLHLAFVQFKMNAARSRAIRHVAACLNIAHSRRYLMLGWSCLKSWYTSRSHTREIAIRSGSNKWVYFLQIVLNSWFHYVAIRIKRKGSISNFQHFKDTKTTSLYFKRWSGNLRIRRHGDALSSVARQFWYLTCSLRCILQWWQCSQFLAARKHALRAFADLNSPNPLFDNKRFPSDLPQKSRSMPSKIDVDQQVELKRILAIRRRKELLTPLKNLLQQRKLSVVSLNSKPVSSTAHLSRKKAEPSTSDVATSAASRRLLSRAFFAWKGSTFLSGRVNNLSAKIVMRHKNCTFIFWKYLVALHRGFSSLAIRMQRSAAKRAMSFWLSRARLEKNSLHSIGNRCRLRFLHFVLSSWKIVGRIDAVACEWRLKRHFAMWIRALPIIWTEQERQGSYLNTLRSTRSAFFKWRSFVHRNKRLLKMLLRGQLLYCKHLLVVVWTSWRLATVSRSLTNGAIHRLQARRNMRALRLAFTTWMSQIGNIQLLRRVFRAAVDRWHLVLTLDSECQQTDIQIMTDHFCAWHMEAKNMKQERLLKSIYATAVVYQSIRRRRTILHCWGRWAYCRCTARKQVANSRLTLLRTHATSWASLTASSKTMIRRVEVRHRRKLLENSLAIFRAAMRYGKCRRGPVSRRYFGILKWYGQSFCWTSPLQHRLGVLRRLVFRAWSKRRLMSLKVSLCIMTTIRCALRRRFSLWIAFTGNRKRAIISHRLANAHASYCIKQRIFRALKRRLADAAVYFFLLESAVVDRAIIAPRQPSEMNNYPPEVESSSLETGGAVIKYLETKSVVQQPQVPLQSKNLGNSSSSQVHEIEHSGTVVETYRAIPTTSSLGSSATNVAVDSTKLNTAKSRQRLFGENVAPRRVSSHIHRAPATNPPHATRATLGTQTAAPSKAKRPPLIVEAVPQRPRLDTRHEAVVLGRAVVSSFILADSHLRTVRSPPSSPVGASEKLDSATRAANKW